MAFLKADETTTAILNKYTNLPNVYLPDLAAKLVKHTKINNHAIDPIDGKQPFYRLIYSPRPVKLKILKTYIKICLANSFIKSSKFSANVPILVVRKLNGNL